MARKTHRSILSRLNADLEQRVRAFTRKQIAKAVNAHTEQDRKTINAALDAMIEQKRLQVISGGRLRLVEKCKEIEGRIEIAGNGAAFLVSDELDSDLVVPPQALHSAQHGDRVRAMAQKSSRRSEGEVIEVLERARTTFAGRLCSHRRGFYAMPDSRRMQQNISGGDNHLNGAEEGDRVAVRITQWTEGRANLIGEVAEVLGREGENNAEMHAILLEYGLPYAFPPEIEEEANLIANDIESEVGKRRDMREVITFTIDPKDAKDYDDALSLRVLANGNYEVGVHIADVTHYVKPDTALDREALRRATSVYLVDRVVPMLPERLSNGLCSLREGEDKLCFSVVFEVTKRAEVVGRWIGRTIIHSNRRFTYEEAQNVIEEGSRSLLGKIAASITAPSDAASLHRVRHHHRTEWDTITAPSEDASTYKEEILTLHRLAQRLRSERFKNGSIAFERAEARFDLDRDGRPIGVYMREENESHQLVEEFMLLANKAVAECGGRVAESGRERAFVYRIHGEPDEQKLYNLGYIAKQMGFGINFDRKTKNSISKAINKLLERVRGSAAQNLIETLALRCMAKAVYAVANIGHYGLAFERYAHFTSPIRRYPDMMAHRMLAHYLAGGSPLAAGDYEHRCKHSSAMEQLAADAERASIKYKMAEYMQDKVGSEFDGIISGVSSHGVYVEISEGKIEGMATYRSFKDDYFYFDEENYRIVGRSTRKTYTLGDAVRIRVVRADMQKRQLDYEVVEKKR